MPEKTPVTPVLARVSREKPEELFRELVQTAMREQGIASSEMAEFYLVTLLGRAIEGGFAPKNLPVPSNWPPPQTLAEAVLAAQNLEPAQRERILQWVGDRALFVSGYFSESLDRKSISPEYYQDMGRLAYGESARTHAKRGFAELFRELSARFSDFVRVIAGVRSYSREVPTTRHGLLIV